MALAESTHHAALRGQKTARAGEWVRGEAHGQVPEAPTPQEPGTRYHDLDDVSVPELGGSRPDRLFAVSGPQERVQRHTVEQMADSAPVLPMLDAPVPLMVEQPVQVLKFLDISLPDVEQVIEVPKIFSEDIPSRSSVSEPQLADQLVEVPTNRVYALAVVAVRTLVSDSHLFVASPEEYMIWIFWEMTSGIISICSALGSTVDTCTASVSEVMASFTYFPRERELGS